MSKQSRIQGLSQDLSQELSAVEQEAIAWLIRLDRDDQPSPKELALLREWLGRSPAHRQALNRVNRFWSNTILTELIVPLVRPQRAPLWRLILSWLQSCKRWQLAAAGTVASLALIAMILLNVLSPAQPEITVYTTAVGQQQMITLPDGSIAHLNTNTQLQVLFSQRARILRLLNGQVHFNVSHDPSRPFQVYGGDGVVEAIGTAFTVSLLKRQMDVLVTEGLVTVSAHKPLSPAADTALSGSTPKELKPGGKRYDIRSMPAGSKPTRLATLAAGQGLSIAQAIDSQSTAKDYQHTSTAIITLSQKDIEQRESWRRGVLIFSGEPLVQAIEEISRFTEVVIEIADPELRSLEIGGRFQVGDVEGMLASLEANFNIDIDRVSENKILIKASR